MVYLQFIEIKFSLRVRKTCDKCCYNCILKFILTFFIQIISHHGKAEWGSAKPPLVREAEILHFIDLIDAKMNMLNQALAKTNKGEFTERIFALDNRSFYKPTFDQCCLINEYNHKTRK